MSAAEARPRAWTSPDVLRIVALALLLWIGLKFLWIARVVLIAGFFGVLFSLPLSRAVDWLSRFKIKRGIAAALVVLSFLGLIAGLVALVAPTIRKQGHELGQRLPAVIDKVESWMGSDPEAIARIVAAAGPGESGGKPAAQKIEGQVAEPVPQAAEKKQPTEGKQGRDGGTSAGEVKKQGGVLRGQIQKEAGVVAKFLFPFVSTTFAIIGGLLMVIFVALFVASDPGLYKRGALHLIPHSRRKEGEALLVEMGGVLEQWLIARLLAMLAIGALTFGLLLMLRVKGAAALGLLAGLLEFVPFFGPIASAIPAIGMGMIDSPQKGLYVALVFIFIQQVEGQIVSPLLLKKKVEIPPALTIVGVAALGAACGIIGVVVAEPLIAAILLVVKRLYVENAIGDDV